MLDPALREPAWQPAGQQTAPALPVPPALVELLPDGLRRGSTVSVGGSVSLVFALLGAASEQGAWCALVGFPPISAESAVEYGIDLARFALVPDPGTGWPTAVAALLDAVDVVVVRLSGRALPPSDARRLAARTRAKGAVFVPYVAGAEWPGADLRLYACGSEWVGADAGAGRLRARQLEIRAAGRGRAARTRSTTLWLPAQGGGVETVTPLARVIELSLGA